MARSGHGTHVGHGSLAQSRSFLMPFILTQAGAKAYVGTCGNVGKRCAELERSQASRSVKNLSRRFCCHKELTSSRRASQLRGFEA